MIRLALALLALAYALPVAALPAIAAAVESGSSALWTFLGAMVGGYASDATRGKARIDAHQRACKGV